jgi:hypothetical protein
LPLHWSLAARVALLIVVGALSYACALLALYRRRMTQLFQAIRRMRKDQIEPGLMGSDGPQITVAGGRLE